MSTIHQVHSGFRFKTDLASAVLATMRFRETARPLVRQRLVELVVGEAVKIQDAHDAGICPLPGGRTALSLAYELWHERQMNIKTRDCNDPEADLEVLIDIFPHDSLVYGRLQTTQDTLREAWFAQVDLVEPWGVWPAEKPPQGVDDAEWDQRARVWREIIGTTRDWSMLGTRVVCNEPWQPHVSEAEVDAQLKQIPLEQRAWVAAAEAITAARFRMARAEAGADASTHDVGALAMRAFNYLTMPEGRAEQRKRADFYKEKLAPVLEYESLLVSGAPSGDAND